MSRKPISKGLRFEIFKRDGFVCQYCGAHPPAALLHVDHINPVKLGGGNEPDNLITACSACNSGKAARPLNAVPKSLAKKAEETAEREAQISGYASVMEAARDRIESEVWRVAEELQAGADAGYSRNKFNGIKSFVVKLGVHDVLESAEIAVSKYPRGTGAAFKYFCGICWRKIRELDN
jgi:DNA-directed RNA polymerase subunit RPC12/RpoP